MRLITLVATFAAMLASGPALADGHLLPEDLEAADKALTSMKGQDSTLQELLDGSAGYAVYPNVGKAGFVLGGSSGRGVAFEGGEVIGGTKLSQVKIGLVAGVATYAQLVVFTTPESWERFKNGKFVAGADAGAVAMKAGGAGSSTDVDGAHMFIFDQDGIMGDISVAGEKFSFEPK